MTRTLGDISQSSKNPDEVGVFTDLGRLIIYKPSPGTNAKGSYKSYVVWYLHGSFSLKPFPARERNFQTRLSRPRTTRPSCFEA